MRNEKEKNSVVHLRVSTLNQVLQVTVEIAQTVATLPRQLHYSNNLSKKKNAPNENSLVSDGNGGGKKQSPKGSRILVDRLPENPV